MTVRALSASVGPIDSSVTLPASKSQLLRCLAAAAMAPGRSHLYNPTAFEDAEAMIRVVDSMGATVSRGSELWAIDGVDGRLTLSEGVVDCGESGLSARIALAMAASGEGTTTITGRGRLPDRPMAGLIDALRQQGVEIHGDRLPIEIHSTGPLWGGNVSVDASVTTQFATALLMVGPLMHEPLQLDVVGLLSSAGYLSITIETLRAFGAEVDETTTGVRMANAGFESADIVLRRDASAAVYPAVAAAMTRGKIRIDGLRSADTHPDMAVVRLLQSMGARVSDEVGHLLLDATDLELSGFEVDMSSSPDGAVAMAVLALVAEGPSRLAGLGSLRHKESDRLSAVESEAKKLGANVEIEGDSLVVVPSVLNDTTVDSHGDHRIAMSFALLAFAGVGLSISDPEVVNKTWPAYWDFIDNLDKK